MTLAWFPHAHVALFVVVVLCMVSTCTCRPTTDALPHSRDFYAGYIKALNDNFDALFKPERSTRSVHVVEQQAPDERSSGSAKILNEIIDDKNLQKTKDSGDKELHKRDVVGEDINLKTVDKSDVLGDDINPKSVSKSDILSDDVNPSVISKSDLLGDDITKTVSTSEVTPHTEVVAKNNNDVGVDKVLLTNNVTVEDELKTDEASNVKSEIASLENKTIDATNASKNGNIEGNNLSEGEGSSGDDDENMSEDAESGNREEASGEYESGIRETSTSDVGSGSVSTADVGSGSVGTSDVGSGSLSTSDVGSGSTDGSEKVPESVATTGSKKTEIQAAGSNHIKGEVDFEDNIKETAGEKREIKSVVINSTVEEASGEKKTITDLGEELTSAEANEKENENEGSGEELASKRNKTDTDPNKQGEDSNYNMDEIEYEDTVTENDDKLLDDKDNAANKTTAEEDLSVAINEDSNNGVQKHTIPNKAHEDANFDVEDSEDFDDDQDNQEENVGIDSAQPTEGDVEETDADSARPQEDTEQTVKKTITAEEDNTEKVANFKEDEDIEDHVPDSTAGSNLPDKEVTTDDKKDDDVTSRRTIVPKANNLAAAVKTHPSTTTTKNVKVASKKSVLRQGGQMQDYPLESDLTTSMLKKIEEPVGTLIGTPRDSQVDEDNQLLTSPEPSYKKYVAGIDARSLEHSLRSLNEYAEGKGLPVKQSAPVNQIGYLTPVTFFSQPPSTRRDEDDGLRRHYILDRSENRDAQYLSSPLSEGFPHVLRDRVASPRLDIPDRSSAPLAGSYVLATRGFHNYLPSPMYNRYEQQVAPDVNNVPYDSRYVNHAYMPHAAATRSDIVSYPNNRRHPSVRSTLIRVPLSLIANFLKNAGGLYRSGDDVAGMYRANDRTGSVRSVVLPRRQAYHQPVVLQPIFVLMPMSFNRAQ